jgi:hypothetical protein
MVKAQRKQNPSTEKATLKTKTKTKKQPKTSVRVSNHFPL